MKLFCMTLLITAIFTMFIGTAAWAGFQGPGAAAPANTVKAILNKPVDDMHITLTGNIVKHLNHDRYLFRDPTGEIWAEIDDDIFPSGVDITPQTLVRITGEVDNEFMRKPEIDVKSIEIVQKTAPKGGFKEK